jgi:hypothetical protein
MRQLRELLRLHLLGGRSYPSAAARSASARARRARWRRWRAAALDWAAVERLTDGELEARLYRPPVPRGSR